MLPLARELLQRGTAVVLAANSQPSINDITAPELSEAVQRAAEADYVTRRALLEGSLTVVPSGNDLPVIDLRKVSHGPLSAGSGAPSGDSGCLRGGCCAGARNLQVNPFQVTAFVAKNFRAEIMPFWNGENSAAGVSGSVPAGWRRRTDSPGGHGPRN